MLLPLPQRYGRRLLYRSCTVAAALCAFSSPAEARRQVDTEAPASARLGSAQPGLADRARVPDRAPTVGTAPFRIAYEAVAQVSIDARMPEGRRKRLSERFRAELCRSSCPQGAITLAELQGAVNALPDYPGLDRSAAELDLRRSTSTPGAIDLGLTIPSRRQIALVVSFDNEGIDASGRQRAALAARFANLTGLGDLTSLEVSRTDEGLVTFAADASLLAGDFTTRYGLSASHLRYALGGELAALGYSGLSEALTGYVRGPLARRERSALAGQVQFGLKRTAADITLLDSHARSRIISVAPSLSGQWGRSDPKRANTAFALGLTLGHLRLIDQPSQTYDALTARTAGTFTKLSLAVRRIQPITGPFSLLARFQWQWASRNLDPSEKFQVTGPDSLRAFGIGQVTADIAAVTGLEGRARLGIDGGDSGYLTLSAFYETGWAKRNRDTWPGYGQAADLRLSDVGAGLQFEVSDRFSLHVTAAREIGTLRTGGSAQRRVWAGISEAFR